MIKKLLRVKEEQEQLIGELIVCLRVPRIYHKFIEEHGVNEFFQYAMDIISKDEAKRQQQQQEKQKLNQRKNQSIENYLKKMVKDQFKIAKNLVRDPVTKQFKSISN